VTQRAAAKPPAGNGSRKPESVESKFDSLIANAPEQRQVPDPAAPDTTPTSAPEQNEDSAPAPRQETPAAPKDEFYSDPLINEALRLFHGKLQE
jgi:hypothetical protein